MSRAASAVLLLALAAAPAAARAQGYTPDNVIDARIRASSEAAESYQGPLDGTWTLVDAAGRPIYALQLVDRVGGRDPLEGVFRDLRRPPVPGDIGLIDSAARAGASLDLTLRARPADPPVTIHLQNDGDGWSGEMREGAAATAVKLRRVASY
jgi:hypothetical protein